MPLHFRTESPHPPRETIREAPLSQPAQAPAVALFPAPRRRNAAPTYHTAAISPAFPPFIQRILPPYRMVPNDRFEPPAHVAPPAPLAEPHPQPLTIPPAAKRELAELQRQALMARSAASGLAARPALSQEEYGSLMAACEDLEKTRARLFVYTVLNQTQACLFPFTLSRPTLIFPPPEQTVSLLIRFAVAQEKADARFEAHQWEVLNNEIAAGNPYLNQHALTPVTTLLTYRHSLLKHFVDQVSAVPDDQALLTPQKCADVAKKWGIPLPRVPPPVEEGHIWPPHWAQLQARGQLGM
ncbi:hypothetical protein JCM6882_001268 [Rhodosporidiobolus microsporus]